MALSAAPALAAEKATVSFLHSLADAGGKLPFSWPSLSWDPVHRELYVVDLTANVIHVFNDNGMVLFSFGDHPAFGAIRGVAPLPGGELLVLSGRRSGDRPWFILRSSFRGEPLGELGVTAVPEAFAADFSPNEIIVTGDRLYLADKEAMRVLVTTLDGAYVQAFDLSTSFDEGYIPAMRGFCVDGRGNLLFTVPTLFKVFVVAPDGSMRSFGTRGSTPGKFNIVSGVASDDAGNIYVADSLRGVVSIFDRHFGFITEFGDKGRDQRLTSPLEIVHGDGRVYVTQSLGGVKAFAVQFE